MEGKRSVAASLPSDPNSGKNTAKSSSSSSSSSGLFSSVFAAPSSVGGREPSRCDIFEPYRKQETAQGLWNLQSRASDGISYAGQNKGINMWSKDAKSTYHGEKIDPCSLSSSLYYGGQDFCKPFDSHTNASSYNYSYTKDGDDNSGGPAIDSRGDWWQGSLYY